MMPFSWIAVQYWVHYNNIQGETLKLKTTLQGEKQAQKVHSLNYLFLNLCGSPDIWHKKLAMASFSGIASGVCNIGNFLVSVALICQVNGLNRFSLNWADAIQLSMRHFSASYYA